MPGTFASAFLIHSPSNARKPGLERCNWACLARYGILGFWGGGGQPKEPPVLPNPGPPGGGRLAQGPNLVLYGLVKAFTLGFPMFGSYVSHTKPGHTLY